MKALIWSVSEIALPWVCFVVLFCWFAGLLCLDAELLVCLLLACLFSCVLLSDEMFNEHGHGCWFQAGVF